MRRLSVTAIALAALTACGYPDTLPDWVDEVPVEGELAPCANARDETVSCVIDGDTFDVGGCGEDIGERFRMLGIDAPEVAHDGEEAQCYAELAAAELARRIDNRVVTLSFDVECTDIYERTLAYVWLDAGEIEDEDGNVIADEGELLNETLLLEGWVRLYDEDWVDDLRLQARLEAAQAEAQAKGLGLWAACEEEVE